MIIFNEDSILSKSLYKLNNDPVKISGELNDLIENNYYYYSLNNNEISNHKIGNDFVKLNFKSKIIKNNNELVKCVIKYYEDNFSEYFIDQFVVSNYKSLEYIIDRNIPMDLVDGYSFLLKICDFILMFDDLNKDYTLLYTSQNKLNKKLKQFLKNFDYNLNLSLVSIFFSKYDNVELLSMYISKDILDLLISITVRESSINVISSDFFVALSNLGLFNSIQELALNNDVSYEILENSLLKNLNPTARKIILKERLLRKYEK